MDLTTAERLASSADPKGIAALKHHKNDPAAARAVAGQFSALLLQNVMQESGAALSMGGDGVGGNVVSGLFASAISEAAASGGKLGLADMLFRSIEAKEKAASGGSAAHATAGGTTRFAADSPRAAGSHSASRNGAAPRGLALGPYWQANGARPGSFATTLAGVGGTPAGRIGPPPAFAMPARAAAPVPGPYAAAAPGFASGLAATPTQIDGFVEQLRPILIEAGKQLGVSPRVLLAHAALETDWGRSVVGNNLFGIKAGGSWQGAEVTTLTHEVEDGQRVPREAAFRAYPSLDAAVQDYVALIAGTPRYRGLVGVGDNAAAYGRGLIAGGYASDTDYERKLEAVAADPAASAAFAVSAPAPLSLFGAQRSAR